jgi:Repeat of unknown function (DUF5648)
MPIDYLMTMDFQEATNAATKLGFVGQASIGWLYGSEQAQTIPLYRLDGPAGHFYTTSAQEQQEVATTPGWSAEGIAGYLLAEQLPGTVPLFRLLGPGGTHFYTGSTAERDGLLLCPGWSLEASSGYLYQASGPAGTGELLRLWHNPVTPPPSTGMSPQQYGISAMIVVNNSANPLLLTGHRGSDLGNVGTGMVIAPFGGTEQVATFDAGDSDHWDWVYLSDLGSPQRYQLYVESTSFGNLYAYFGYRDDASSESNGNHDPFPNGTASAGWGGNGQWTYTLNTTPLLAETDLQALTDHLGFLLAGENFRWTASSSYDTSRHTELAPYLADQVSAVAASEAVYGDQSTWTITNGAAENHPGCYQNSTINAVTQSYTYSYTRQTSFQWSLTETINVTWKNSTTVGLPVAGDKSTTDWSVSITVASTQTQTKTDTITQTKAVPIAVPANTTVAWLVSFVDQAYVIPFTIPITLTGWVAIKSAQPVAGQVLNQAAATQIGTHDGDYLVLAPFGALLQYCQSVSASVTSLPFSYSSANQVTYAMSGTISGGPLVADYVDTKAYPALGNGQPPACSNSLIPVPPVQAG